LGGFLVERAEDIMKADFARRMPGPMRLLLPPILMWRFRHLAHHIPEAQRQEIWGFASVYDDRRSFPLDAYQRGIYYHGLHDMVQDLVGNPFVDPGVAGACTAFAGSGGGTVDGHTIVGRNFDFEVVPMFDAEKVVHVYARDGAIPVISVSWAGMSGVLTGMNADGIWISLNAARSEGRNKRGPPVSTWVRDLLEHADSLADVERMLGETAPVVSDIYVVADGKTGEIAVWERGQTRIGKLLPDGSGRIGVSNHLRSETFRDDEDDLALRTWSTTVARGLRVDELVAAEPLSVDRGIAILRDRRGPGGVELAPGNRNAIDAFIATHSVVADVTDRVSWVSSAPHTQGAYRAVDLLAELDRIGVDTARYRARLPAGARGWERAGGERPAPAPGGEAAPYSVGTHPSGGAGGSSLATGAAAVLHTRSPGGPPPGALPILPPSDRPPSDLSESGELATVFRYFALLDDAAAFVDHEDTASAITLIQQAEALYPRSAEAARLRGDALREDEAAARAAYFEYLARFPPRGPEYGRTLKWLTEHGGLPDNPRPDALPGE
jgi:hypothetical protein